MSFNSLVVRKNGQTKIVYFDKMTGTKPDAVTELYTYYDGTRVVATKTVTYETSAKEFVTQVSYS